MQILGKKSKVLLMAIAITMLIAIGVSFALWDSNAVKATSGDLNTYANAKVGDAITFGKYYQSKIDLTKKDPITWIVVDKDERTGQLTLLSEKIIACGSYFANWYDDGTGYNWNYNITPKDDGSFSYSTSELNNTPFNQAYVDSTVRAYLNNLERLDMGGDQFTEDGYLPSNKNSTMATGLLSSVGFSNQRYWTDQYTDENGQSPLLSKSGFIKRDDNTEIYYQRPINNPEFTNRPVTKGFLDEAFTDKEKAMIVPKAIAGYIGHRWPDNAHDISTKSYVEGAYDKIWLPSASELNVSEGYDWNGQQNDAWTNPSDEAGSTVFNYFKNYQDYGFASVADALKATRTELATDGKAGNFSIPVYDKGTTIAKTAISTSANTSNHYLTRSPSSYWFRLTRIVNDLGLFDAWSTFNSYVGVRPCMILQY